MGFWLSPAVLTRDPIIRAESLSSRADNGLGLILRVMIKLLCNNLFITYSETLFQIILIKESKQNINFFSKIEELRHNIVNVISPFRGVLTSHLAIQST